MSMLLHVSGNIANLKHAESDMPKKEWVTKLVDSMFLLERSGNDKYMQRASCQLRSCNMGFNRSHRERANLKAAIEVGIGVSENKESKTQRAESGRVAGSVETGTCHA